MDNRPIGVFDSGLGGLTVLKEIMGLIPSESVVYFGDCGRAPYGTKSREMVIKYTFQDIRFLMEHDIKMMVIACNTMSACSLENVKHDFDIPVIEVVQPGSRCAVRETRNKRVGVIGTAATIGSGVYEKTIKSIDNSIDVFSKACPLFVNLVEEGWWDNDIALRIAEEYLGDLKKEKVDTLVLGCTHYPLLKNVIQKVMGDDVKLVSSAMEVAKVLKEIMQKDSMLRQEKLGPVYKYYTSDDIEKFDTLGSAILEKTIDSTDRVEIDKY
jgi:glutamate racemase